MPLSLYAPGGRASSCTYTSSPLLPTSSPFSFSNSIRSRRFSDSGRYGYSTSYASTLPQYGYAPGCIPGYTALAQQLPGPWGTPIMPSSPYIGTHAYNSPYMASADPGIGMLMMPPRYPNNQLGVMGVPYNASMDPRQSPYYQYQSYPPVPRTVIIRSSRRRKRH